MLSGAEMEPSTESWLLRAPASELTLAPHHKMPRKVDVKLPGKGNSNSHGARPVHQIVSLMMWIWTSRLSTKNSLSSPNCHRSCIKVDMGPN